MSLVFTEKNENDGVEARVTLMFSGRYSVGMWDTDANMCVPSVKMFQNLPTAISYAKALVRSWESESSNDL